MQRALHTAGSAWGSVAHMWRARAPYRHTNSKIPHARQRQSAVHRGTRCLAAVCSNRVRQLASTRTVGVVCKCDMCSWWQYVRVVRPAAGRNCGIEARGWSRSVVRLEAQAVRPSALSARVAVPCGAARRPPRTPRTPVAYAPRTRRDTRRPRGAAPPARDFPHKIAVSLTAQGHNQVLHLV